MSFTPSVTQMFALKDKSGVEVVSTSGRPVPTYVLARSIAATIAESMTIPAGCNVVVISTNVDLYVNCNATAVVPGDVTDGSAPELLSAGTREVLYLNNTNEATTISVITAATVGIVTAACYQV